MQPRSTRLNQENKDKFIKAVVEDKLPTKNAPTKEPFFSRWEPKIYDILFKEYEEVFQKLPKYMLKPVQQIQLFMTGADNRKQAVAFDMHRKHMLPVGIDAAGWGANLTTCELPDQTHPIFQDYKQVCQSIADWSSQQNELRKTLRKLVDSCNTSGQLYAAWPEAVNYADCFPYVGPKRHSGAAVSQTEMDLSVLMAKASVKLTDESG